MEPSLSESIGNRAKEERKVFELLTKGKVTAIEAFQSPPKVRIDGRLMPIIHADVEVGDVVFYFNTTDPLAIGKAAEDIGGGDCSCVPAIQRQTRPAAFHGFYGYSGEAGPNSMADTGVPGTPTVELPGKFYGNTVVYGGGGPTTVDSGYFEQIPTILGDYENQTDLPGSDYWSVMAEPVVVGLDHDFVLSWSPAADMVSNTWTFLPGPNVQLHDIAHTVQSAAGNASHPRVNVANDGDLVLYMISTGLYSTEQSYFSPDPAFFSTESFIGPASLSLAGYDRDYVNEPGGRRIQPISGCSHASRLDIPSQHWPSGATESQGNRYTWARIGSTTGHFFERHAAAALSTQRTGYFTSPIPRVLVTASFTGVNQDLGSYRF